MTPDHIKFFFNLAGFFLILAGICYMALTLPERIRDIKYIYNCWTKGKAPLLSDESKKGDEE